MEAGEESKEKDPEALNPYSLEFALQTLPAGNHMVPVAQYRTMERSSQEDLKKTDAVFVSCLLWGVGLFRDGWNLLQSFHVFFRNQAVEASLAVFSGCWH